MRQIPNLFTLLNLVFGCIAIVFTLQTNQSIVHINSEGFTSWSMPENMTMASIFIFAAAVVDFFDGFIARLLRANSEMGKQLDSLADVVSFGVAPGLILYQLLRISFAGQVNGLEVGMTSLLPAFLIPCAVAWRLARFNIDTEQATVFKGVPAPAAGITIASLPLIIHFQNLNLQEYLFNKWVLYAIIIIISILLVSRLAMMSLKFNKENARTLMPWIILAIITIASLIFFQWAAVLIAFIAYVILSLFFTNKKFA